MAECNYFTLHVFLLVYFPCLASNFDIARFCYFASRATVLNTSTEVS